MKFETRKQLKGGLSRMEKIMEKASLLVATMLIVGMFATPFALATGKNDPIKKNRMNRLATNQENYNFAVSNTNGKVLFGDVNADENVDISDLVVMTQYFNGARKSMNNPDAADFNQDGQADWEDAVSLANQLFLGSNPVLLGDANYDGKVDISDIVVLGQYLNGVHYLVDLDNADFNQDGFVNRVDLSDLQTHLFGQTVEERTNKAEQKPRAVSKINKIPRRNSLTVNEVANKVKFDSEEINEELENVKNYKSSANAISFPVVAYYGSGEGMKFVLFEKRSSERKPLPSDIEITGRYFSGKISLKDGITYAISGTDLKNLRFDIPTDATEAFGKASFDFSKRTVTIVYPNGEEVSYKIEDISREIVRDGAPGIKVSETEKSVNTVVTKTNQENNNLGVFKGKEKKIGFWARLKNVIFFWR